jgi:hypothetical protein
MVPVLEDGYAQQHGLGFSPLARLLARSTGRTTTTAATTSANG